MIQCLIGVLIIAIILLVLLMVAQKVIEQFGIPVPWQLLYLLVGLVVLLYLLPCFGMIDLRPPFHAGR